MPDFTKEVRARLSSLRLAPTREHEIVEELSQHLEDRWRELVAKGMSADEATRQTLALFREGDLLAKYIATLKQADPPAPITPGVSTGRAWPDVRQHIRYAARILWKQPGFAAIAVLTLALGIGATTAIFSVVYGVLLKPLPFPEPDRLVAIYHFAPGIHPEPKAPQTSGSYFTYREHSKVFEDIGLASWRADAATVVRRGEPESVQVLAITDGLLSVLRVRPALGRLIQKEDDLPGAPKRVVLSHGYWQRAFGASPAVVGQSLVISAPNPEPYEVIGVLPASFKFRDFDVQALLPIKLDRAEANPGAFGYRAVARLKQGVTVAQANADIARMIPLITKQFPLPPGVTQEMWEGVGLAPNVMRLSDDVIGEMRRPLWILLGTVAIVLVLAWVNVANLLLVRAEGRQRELAVRRALGASPGRIAGDLLSESLMLGLAGGALGVVFARAAIALLRYMSPAALPRVDEIGIDPVVLLVTLATSVVTSLLFGLIPILKSRVLSVSLLNQAGRSMSDAPARHRTRNTLVVAQVALALVLLIGSGLMARTFVALRQVDPGYVQPANVQTFGVSFPESLVPEGPQVALTHEAIVERLAQVPGVTHVGLAGVMLMQGTTPTGPIFVEGQPVTGLPTFRKQRAIGPAYFETMGSRVVAGRAFAWADVHQRARIAVVSENLAREYWGEPSNAIGKRIRGGPNGNWSEIVGVSGNERDDGLNQPAPAIVFWPMARASREITYIVRSSRVQVPGFLRELQDAVWAVNKNVPLANARTLGEIEARSISQTSFAMVMLAISAGVALLLGVVGIYGVIRYIVAQRTREIGIRMALGAQAGDVRLLFLRHGLVLTMAGIAIGIGGAIVLSRVMTSLLFGVAPTDPFTYVAASVGLGAVAVLATYLPARRASATDPIVVLRADT